MKIKKGDKVKILKGKDRGKEGVVARAWPAVNKVTLDGLHLFKKHQKPRKQGEKGQTVQIARPMDVSNVQKI